jgi:hypothetical protein
MMEVITSISRIDNEIERLMAEKKRIVQQDSGRVEKQLLDKMKTVDQLISREREVYEAQLEQRKSERQKLESDYCNLVRQKHDVVWAVHAHPNRTGGYSSQFVCYYTSENEAQKDVDDRNKYQNNGWSYSVKSVPMSSLDDRQVLSLNARNHFDDD